MLMGNMMEDKQLNYNRPLLSVRRHPSTVVTENDNKRNTRSSLPSIPRPPVYKSELKSGPVGNAGTVPFQWEQSPGRPKDEGTAENHIKGAPVAPKLPPGRILIANQQDNDSVSANAVVTKSQDKNFNGSQNALHLDGYRRGTECYEDVMEKAHEEKAESEDEDEVYEDALDTLSRAESSFLNCSMSGISGFDGSDVKPFGTGLTDPQAKEFIIGRFLPAAKAMVVETPQYAPSKKQPSMIEDHPKQPKKLVKGDNLPQLRYGPSFARHYSEPQYNGDEESDDEMDETGENENFHAKGCGLIPKFCLKGSLGLLNPLPAMSVRTRIPARKLRARSSSASTWSKTENELSSFDSSEQRSIDGSQTTEPLEDKNDVTSKSNEVYFKSQIVEGSSTDEHGGLSVHHNESSLSVECVACPTISTEVKDVRDNGFSHHEKAYKSFRDLLAYENISEEVDSGGSAVEKTLYVDTVHEGKTLEQKACTFTRKELTNSKEDVAEVSMNIVETNLLEDPSLVKKLSNVVEDISNIGFQKVVDSNLPTLASETSQVVDKIAPKAFEEDEQLFQDAAGSEMLELPTEKAAQSLRKETPRAERLQNFHGIFAEFPVPPPLPNSPSDSWLGRTLPSMSLKNSSRLSHFGTGINGRNQASKAQSGDPKWETIVRATNVHHHHLRYSEELLAPIPES